MESGDHNGAHRAADAVRKAVDPDRLLEGENPDTDLAEDARHWMEVYSELVQFKEKVVATAHSSLDGVKPEVVKEAQGTDLALLAEERSRLRRRLSYWENRFTELQAQQN